MPLPEQYRLASLRYDLSKLRVKGLVEQLPRSRRYHLPADGYSVCLMFLKLFERIYAPLTAAHLPPSPVTQPSLHKSARCPIASTSASTPPLTGSYTPSASHLLPPSTRTKSSLMPP